MKYTLIVLLANLLDNLRERDFPRIHFDCLNALNDLIQNSDASIRLSDHSIAISGRHFSHDNCNNNKNAYF